MDDVGHILLHRVAIDKLNPAEYNPREMSDHAREGLSNSINSFGLLQPIVWNKTTGNVVGGHQRLYDIIAKGAQETDVIIVEWPLSKEKAANIALNHAGIAGRYDEGKLQQLLTQIDDSFIADLNFDELILPEWTNLPDIIGDHNLGEPPVKVHIIIPKKNEYIKDEMIQLLAAEIKSHWPDHGIKIE